MKGYEKPVFMSVNDVLEVKHNHKMLWLSHYAHRTWNKSHYGTYHIYAHSHGALLPYGLSFDTGVDSFNFSPVSFDMVIAIMDKLANNPTIDQQNWDGLAFLSEG